MSNTWLHTRLAAANQGKTTVAILVDKSEVEQLVCLKPHNSSLHWRQDLTLHKYAWVYAGDRRVLVI